jgi:tripartite-type tricarboxylate transporter receptor subunit TctC
VKLSRRQFLLLAAGAAALTAMLRITVAQSYPSRPVHLVVGYPPGGAPDIVSRLVAEWLSERLGQQFIVDNRAGAGSNIGTEIVAKAPPDGYMLFMAVSTNAVNATPYTDLNFNFINDFAANHLLPVVEAVHSNFSRHQAA